MRKIILVVLIFPCFSILYGQNDSLKEPSYDISFCSEIDFCSQYIFRGIIVKNNFVSQPGISASYRSFSAGLWCNINSFVPKQSSELSDLDIFVNHELALGSLYLNNTAALYLYPGNDPYPTTAEYTLNAAYYTGPVGYYTEFNVDFMEYAGAFIVTHGIYYGRKLTRRMFFNSTLGISWSGSKYNNVNAGLDRTLFNYAGLDISLTYFPAGGIFIKPHIQYNRVLDSELQQYLDKQNIFYGILTGYTF